MNAKRKEIVLFAIIVVITLITFVAIPVVYLSKSKPPGDSSKVGCPDGYALEHYCDDAWPQLPCEAASDPPDLLLVSQCI